MHTINHDTNYLFGIHTQSWTQAMLVTYSLWIWISEHTPQQNCT